MSAMINQGFRWIAWPVPGINCGPAKRSIQLRGTGPSTSLPRDHTVRSTFDGWTSPLLRVFLPIWYVSAGSPLGTSTGTLKNGTCILMASPFATLSRWGDIGFWRTIPHPRTNQIRNLQLSQKPGGQAKFSASIFFFRSFVRFFILSLLFIQSSILISCLNYIVFLFIIFNIMIN